jgi:hypothetical protein
MSVSLKSIANYGSSGKSGTGPHKKWTDQLGSNRKDPVHSTVKVKTQGTGVEITV